MSPTSLEQLVRDARRNNDYSPLVELIPYAKLLGIECLRLGDDMVFACRRTRTTSATRPCRPSMAA